MKPSEKRKQQIEYSVNRILAECEKTGYNIIGITSSLERNELQGLFVELCQLKTKEKQMQVEFCDIESVCYFAQGLEKARKCDAIVLLERYMQSTYKNVIKITEYLESMNIKLMGTVNLY